MALTDRLLDAWYNGHPALTLLRPLEALYRRVVDGKRARFIAGQGDIYKAPVPVTVASAGYVWVWSAAAMEPSRRACRGACRRSRAPSRRGTSRC